MGKAIVSGDETGVGPPAILGYYPIDEPEYWHRPNCVPRQLDRFDRFVKKIDPYHPSMISHAIGGIHYGKSEGMVFNDAVDIRIYELYSENLEGIVRRMEQVKGIGHSDRAQPWIFIRAGAAGRTPPRPPMDYRATCYASFACGYRGIMIFNSMTIRCSGHEIWPHLSAKVYQEIQTLAESRLAEDAIALPVEKSHRFLPVMMWKQGGALWIVTSNASEGEDLKMNLKLPAGLSSSTGQVDTLFQNMPAAHIQTGYLHADVQNHQVGAWRIPLN